VGARKIKYLKITHKQAMCWPYILIHNKEGDYTSRNPVIITKDH
jgi:hypothetical protein